MSHEGRGGAARATVLKALLLEKHLQEHRAFNREYDRVASTLDKALVGKGPAKATFYRWLSGDVRKLPYPFHCRILEKMLPGWTVQQLFEPWEDDGSPAPINKQRAANTQHEYSDLAGLTAVFTSRPEFAQRMPPDSLFADATSVDAAGLSLNFICQQYPDRRLRSLLARARVRLLFLDPLGDAINRRNAEEEHEPGILAHLTTANINVVRRIRDGLDEDAASRVEIRTYDETIRFNIMLVDNQLGIMQPYLPQSRGVDAPSFVMKRKDPDDDLYGVFAGLFDTLWERGKSI